MPTRSVARVFHERGPVTGWMVAAGAALAAPLAAAVFSTGPPAGHTGGFGEPTCIQCHFQMPLNDPPGMLDLKAARAACGKPAPVTFDLLLTRPGLARGGFQAAVRYVSGERAGRQAGSWSAENDRLQIVFKEGSEVEYLEHTRDATAVEVPDTVRWSLVWLPPDGGTEPVVLHVAANAADDDGSPFGDYIYRRSLIWRVGPGGDCD